MGLFRRNRITRMATQLENIEHGLLSLKKSNKIPTPADMQAMKYMHFKLPLLIKLCTELEPEFWERIRTWQETPYSRPVRFIRSTLAFISAWCFGVFAIHAGGLWVLDKFLPMPCSLIVSAILSLSAIIVIIRAEHRHKDTQKNCQFTHNDK